ncbi:MAG: transporter substrate-binding domain-containing protein [Treponema sp.]|nr:transporter substrate-binding domain-containing protein [Treponema sp.]
MKRAILVIFAVLLASGVLFAGGRRDSGGLTIKQGVLMVGMEIGYPPMEYFGPDGRTPVGFDVEMSKALASKMGLTVEFVDTAWDGIFSAVNTSKFDCIISSVTINPARLAAHNFSKPYIQNTLAIVVPKASTRRVRSPQDLAGLRVAYQDETTSDYYMGELASGGLKFTTYEYDKVMYCFDELRLNRVDAIMTDLLVAYEYVSQADSPFEIVWQGGEEEFGICMRKGNNALTEAINKALDELFNDGTMLRISREIFGMDLVSAVR